MTNGRHIIKNGLRGLKLIIVLDSNEYIFYLNEKIENFNKMFQRVGFYVHLHKSIRNEVLKNIRDDQKNSFYKLIIENNILVNEEPLSLELFKKYEMLGFKKGDITIASFCEKIKADFLITENRDFLKSKKFNFQVLSLQKFLEMFKLI